MALAIRRNLSNGAARDLGAVLMIDVSHPTVTKYETLLAAALTAHSRRFHLHCEARFHQETQGWNVAFHSFRSDATTSNVWHHSKLMVADLLSAYVCSSRHHESDHVDENNHKAFDSVVSLHHAWCELQRVGEFHSGADVHYVLVLTRLIAVMSFNQLIIQQ